MKFQSLKENNHPQIWIQERKIVDYFMIGATISIGREILCLLYAEFFENSLKKPKTKGHKGHKGHSSVTQTDKKRFITSHI